MTNNVHNVRELGLLIKHAGVPKNLWDMAPTALKTLLRTYCIRVDLDIIKEWQKTL
jgi:hypothetical protein